MILAGSDHVGQEAPAVAIVGAGLSGLACARTLADHGWHVHVLEKGRGVGGRMATRRTTVRSFDHGAQYFTVRDVRFRRQLESWLRDGVVAPWNGKIGVLGSDDRRSGDSHTERFVGVPGMNALCRDLAVDLKVSFATQIVGIECVAGRWHLDSNRELDLGTFDAIVVSAPAPQAMDLLKQVAPALASRAAEVEMQPCWSTMLSFDAALGLDFDGAFVHGSPLSWVARNTSKPGRMNGEAWVLHASPDWSRDYLELDKEAAAQLLLDAFRTEIGPLAHEPTQVVAHRWRFALPTEPLPEACLFDAHLAVGACGDWCGGPRVEGAFLSGCALADRILASDLAR